MTRKLVVCAASMPIIVAGTTLLATPVRAAASITGDCPLRVATELTAIAEKSCKAKGMSAVITQMSCDGGVATFSYECV
jgi:hypothetical protein